MTEQVQSIRGMSDILPPDTAAWSRIEAAIRVAFDPLPRIRRLAQHIRRQDASLMRRLARPLARPLRLRFPRAGSTLNTLGALLGLAPLPPPDSS